MSQFRVTGGVALSGSLTISGRKNAALKLIAASILSEQDIMLHRVPLIGDVSTMFTILREMGAQVEQLGEDSYKLNTREIPEPVIPVDLGRKLRASLVLVGPMLARFGRVSFPHPGGCVIGKRTIAPHLDALRQLGAQIEFDGNMYSITSNGLKGSEVYLKERSVTGTENLLMAATRANGTTHIYNAAEEPHIRNLANLLRSMGFVVEGDGSSHIMIEGRPDHMGTSAEEQIIADEIEVGTFAVASVITNGTVTLNKVGPRQDLYPILAKLDDFRVNYHYSPEDESLALYPSPDLTGASVQTQTWPGFPSDLQSPFAVLATQAQGTSLIHDWMYEGRIYFVDLLHRMGANVVICDPHRSLISGPTKLNRSSLITPDLRAGAALVLAALAAEGTSIIEHSELIERGYVKLDQRLASLGANITREE